MSTPRSYRAAYRDTHSQQTVRRSCRGGTNCTGHCGEPTHRCPPQHLILSATRAPVTQCDEEPDFTVPHPTYRPGDRVRIKHALHRGQTGKIERYFPATENYLVAIDGMPDMIVLTDAQMEAV
jgi:hypothetical protein